MSRHTVFAEADSVIFKGARISGRVGENLYDNDVNNLNGTISLQLDPSEKFTAVLSYEHLDIIDKEQPFLGNPIYNHVVTIGSVGLNIRTNDYSAWLNYRPFERVYLTGEWVYGDYSDGNRKQSYMLESGYILKRTPRVRLSYNYFYLDYQNPAPVYTENQQRQSAYYDPINFEVHTLRLEYRNETSRRFSYGAEEAVSFIPKSNGFSNSFFVFGAVEFNKNHKLRLDGRIFYQNKGIDRIGKTGYFDAKNVSLSYEYRF